MSTKAASGAAQPTVGPVGRDEVVAATLAAAADLFAERGPAATSIRDIAVRAGVNHGLIHRHFGSKDRLVGAVLDHLGQNMAELFETKAENSRIDAAVDQQIRVLARATLDGYPVGELQTRFPTVAEGVESMLRLHPDHRTARLAAAHAIALPLSWRLFGAFLRASTGLDDLTEDELSRSLADASQRLTEVRTNEGAGVDDRRDAPQRRRRSRPPALP